MAVVMHLCCRKKHRGQRTIDFIGTLSRPILIFNFVSPFLLQCKSFLVSPLAVQVHVSFLRLSMFDCTGNIWSGLRNMFRGAAIGHAQPIIPSGRSQGTPMQVFSLSLVDVGREKVLACSSSKVYSRGLGFYKSDSNKDKSTRNKNGHSPLAHFGIVSHCPFVPASFCRRDHSANDAYKFACPAANAAISPAGGGMLVPLRERKYGKPRRFPTLSNVPSLIACCVSLGSCSSQFELFSTQEKTILTRFPASMPQCRFFNVVYSR